MTFRARISKVRMKDGATVSVLPTPVNQEGDNIRGTMIRCAKQIADHEGELTGCIVVGFWSDGRRSFGGYKPEGIPNEMLPAYVSEIVRTDMIVEQEAERVFHSNFEWVEA